MLFRHCVAVRVAWTSATGTASRDPTPPLRVGQGSLRARSKQATKGGWVEGGRGDRRGKRKGWQLCPTGNCQVAAKRSGRTSLCPLSRPSSINRASAAWNASFHQKIMAFKKRHASRGLLIYHTRGFRLYQYRHTIFENRDGIPFLYLDDDRCFILLGFSLISIVCFFCSLHFFL